MSASDMRHRFARIVARSALVAASAVGLVTMVDPPALSAAQPDPLAPITHGLVDQYNRPLTPQRLAGKFVLVNFIFTGCGTTCPIQTAELARFDASLPPAVRRGLVLVSVSVDPANDTPAALRRYADLFHADGRRWAFVTGNPAQLAEIARSFAAFRPGAGQTAFHTSDVRLFDPRHRMIQRYAAAPLAERQLREDLLSLSSSIK